MGSKHAHMVIDKAAPHLYRGERVEVTAFTTMGSVSIKRQVLTAAIVGIASGGTVIATARPSKRYVALTNQRLMVFDGEASFRGHPGKLLFSVPREAVQVADVSSHRLFLRVDLAIEGQAKGLRVNFPFASRAFGEQIAGSLRNSAPARRPQPAQQDRRDPREGRYRDDPRPRQQWNEPRPQQAWDSRGQQQSWDDARQQQGWNEPRPQQAWDDPRPRQQRDEPRPRQARDDQWPQRDWDNRGQPPGRDARW
jgi:hypothetical protein